MSSPTSVTVWLSQLRGGEYDALQNLWDRYSDRLVELARIRLDNAPRQLADEQDIVNSVFHSLCRGAQAGRFHELQNRDELWWLLLAITRRKVVDHVRRETAQKRGGGYVETEANLAGSGRESIGFRLDQLVGTTPTPDLLVALDEEHERLLGLLRDDQLRSIATARIEGYSVQEIAERMGIAKRSVERKLDLIRKCWGEEMGDERSDEST